MDNLTHSLAGALLGQAGLKRKTGLAMPALIIGANLPDVDAACFFWLDGLEHLAFRRGITHGPPALILLPLLLAGALWAYDRWQTRRGTRPEARLPVHFGWLYALAFIGCVSHPALDWMNVYGIRLLEPFSSQWFHGDVLFIIDIWLWLGMGYAVWFSLRRERGGGEWRRPARVAIAGVLAYIGLNGLITYLDHRWDYRDAFGDSRGFISSPVPILFWRRDQIQGWEEGNWYMFFSPHVGSTDKSYIMLPSPELRCKWPDLEQLRQSNSELDAFLFWSRAPFVQRADDGSVLIRDARYADSLSNRGFTVALPDVACEPLPG